MAYNEEEYIRDALEGFLSQRATFRFEVLAYDDASTDKTPQIIREYAERYPDIIVPILQTENQMSQGVDIIRSHLAPKMRGKYVTFCDGDDYFCDENKLQMQINFLQEHPDYSCCLHNAKRLNVSTQKTSLVSARKDAYDIMPEDIIERFTRGNLQNSTACFRRADAYDLDTWPAYFTPLWKVGAHDFVLMLHLCAQGKMRYQPQVMSVYRYLRPGSYSAGCADTQRLAAIRDGFCEALRLFDQETNGQYHESVLRGIAEQEGLYLELTHQHEKLLLKENAALFRQRPRITKLAAVLKVYVPWMYRLMCKILRGGADI